MHKSVIIQSKIITHTKIIMTYSLIISAVFENCLLRPKQFVYVALQQYCISYFLYALHFKGMLMMRQHTTAYNIFYDFK